MRKYTSIGQETRRTDWSARESLPRKKVKDASQIRTLRETILANADWIAATGENGGKIRYDGNDYTRAQLLAGGEAVLNKVIRRKEPATREPAPATARGAAPP